MLFDESGPLTVGEVVGALHAAGVTTSSWTDKATAQGDRRHAGLPGASGAGTPHGAGDIRGDSNLDEPLDAAALSAMAQHDAPRPLDDKVQHPASKSEIGELNAGADLGCRSGAQI